MSTKPSPTLAVAVLALVAALAGTAIADQGGPIANGSGKATKLAKKASKQAKKAIAIAEAAEKQQGPQGPPGERGPRGDRGPAYDPPGASRTLDVDDDEALFKIGDVTVRGLCRDPGDGSLRGSVKTVPDPGTAAGKLLVVDDTVNVPAVGDETILSVHDAAAEAGKSRAFALHNGADSFSGIASLALDLTDPADRECEVRVHAVE